MEPSPPTGSGIPTSSSAVTTPTHEGGASPLAFDHTLPVRTPGVGTTVFNRYQLERVLGRGGMGVVWLAHDLKLERKVALKFLPSLIGIDPSAVRELKTETRRGLELSHPNIVRIYDFVDDEDTAAISMEFIDGKTLSELRLNTQHGVFNPAQISEWLAGVCDALDYAHFQRKVIHRDLKPANIMLMSANSVAKIADFGIARSLSDTMSRLSVTQLGGTSGTLPYMSPQQAMGERPMPTDDVYSLGATLYELLTGKPPFYRGDLSTQIHSKIPPSIQERRKELECFDPEPVPKLWEDVIAACLHKEPQLRPSCAGALAEMLGLKTGTITSLTRFRTSRPAPAPEPPAKNHLPLYAGIAATLTLTAGVAWYLTQPTAAATNAPPVPVPSVATKAPETEPALAVKPPPPPAPTAPTQPPTPEQPAANMAVAAQAEPKPAEPTKPKPAEESIPPAPATAPPLAAAPSAPDTPAPIATVKPDSTPESAPASAVSMSTVPSFNFGTPIQLAAPPATIPFPTTPSNDSPSSAPAVHAQPNPGEPPAGFWTLEELYPHPPFSDYSANGRKYLLYRTQSLLKQRGLYNSNVDGREGKGTHLAIRLFQVESGLQPTGMLDEPTLVALDLDDTPDNPTWTTRSISGNSRSGPRRPRGPKEEPGFWKKFGDTVTKPFR